jgi:hypothetical protein
MVKRHGRPSLQYRYEHYDPWFREVLISPQPERDNQSVSGQPR